MLVSQLIFVKPLFAQSISYSHDRGFYDEPFKLTISTLPSFQLIYFTTDCSTPSKNNGTIYSNHLVIDKTSVIRVKAYSSQDSIETALSYIFLDDVIKQSNANSIYPDSWADGVPAHYTLTKEITENAQYKNRLKPALLALPTVSISTERSNLFGTTGIYTNSIEGGSEWEKRTAVEFIFPESGTSCVAFSGLRIHGDASRVPEKSPKHSFKLYFRAEYGDAKLDFPLFDQTTNTKFDELVLRAGYNNSWIHYLSPQRLSAQYISDEWVRRSYKEMGNPSVIGDFFHLYINGLYWGVYNITEKLSADFMEEYIGGDKETWNVINSGEAVDGEVKPWTDLMSQLKITQSPDDLYEILKTKIDITNFIDYMIINYFTGMEDWGAKNWYAACSNSDTARFHFFCWDSERSLEELNHSNIGLTFENSPITIFNKIKNVDEFALLFADRVYKHLYNDGVLTAEKNQKRWNVLSDKVREALIAESARWGNYRRDVHKFKSSPYLLYTVDDHWITENVRIYSSYFPQRNNIFINQLISANLYPRTEAPTYNYANGYIPKTEKLEMSHKNEGGDIYYTIDGPLNIKKYTTPLSINKGTLIGSRYISADGELSPLNEIMLFPEQDYNSLMISEIMYNSSVYPEFIEILNAGSEVISLEGLKFTDGIQLNFALSDKIDPYSSIVVTNDSLKFLATYDLQAHRQFEKKLSNEGETLILSDYFNNIIDSISYQWSSPWPKPLPSSNKSIELISAAFDNSFATSWRLSDFSGGTPFDITLPLKQSGAEILGDKDFNFITIYPNPATDYVKIIRNYKDGDANSVLLIYNSTGTLVYQDIAETNDNIEININFLKSGLYLFVVKTKNQLFRTKILIQ